MESIQAAWEPHGSSSSSSNKGPPPSSQIDQCASLSPSFHACYQRRSEREKRSSSSFFWKQQNQRLKKEGSKGCLLLFQCCSIDDAVKTRRDSCFVKMPVFHTKTIESILDPVAQQVRQFATFSHLKTVKFQERSTYFQC